MAQRSMIIVGAGVGGLAAGCYARMNGYDAHIREMGDPLGGCCTSWRRGDSVFDGHRRTGQGRPRILHPSDRVEEGVRVRGRD